ncbi:MAG TPA: tyrosine/phenylalanine carboxypeptidase domain-containing protein, partial [Gemmataceae bacterium]
MTTAMDAQIPGDDDPPLGPTGYHTAARALGDRLLAAVRPVRVLNTIRWDASVEHAFLARGGRELPPITPASYRPLPFAPAAKRQELLDLEYDVHRRLGRGEPLARLLRRRCRQARLAVQLLAHRGTPTFVRLAREAYGRPTPVEDAAADAILGRLADAIPTPPASTERILDATAAAGMLAARLGDSLAGTGPFRVRLSNRLLSDAAACGRSVKLRRGARFSPADVAMLEVHEGWV